MRSEVYGMSRQEVHSPNDTVFLSVASNFTHGPGIRRNGLTSPTMTDPHAVPGVINSFLRCGLLDQSDVATNSLPSTTNAYIQRAGTPTIYHHIKEFLDTHGSDWLITGVQSNGDLTMNPGHIAYVQSVNGNPNLCGLRTPGDPQEDFVAHSYVVFVKWKEYVARAVGRQFEFLEVRCEPLPDERWLLKLVDRDRLIGLRGVDGFDHRTNDIGKMVDFALSGKPIIHDGKVIPLAHAVDRFTDVRHVFNLPEVRACAIGGKEFINKINFGEELLFARPNERRAALLGPLVVPLVSEVGRYSIEIDDFVTAANDRHYASVREFPTVPGQYRIFEDAKAVEIFFLPNVYPFGAIGGFKPSALQQSDAVAGLSFGGKSGRIGTTIGALTTTMYNYVGCSEAIILDEGLDTFYLLNPYDGQRLEFDNNQFLDHVLTLSHELLEADVQAANKIPESIHYCDNAGLRGWTLNRRLLAQMPPRKSPSESINHTRIVAVAPGRAQVRSVLIFATRKQHMHSK